MHPGDAEGEVPGRCAKPEGEGELRVLRAGQAAAPASCHHDAAGQGLHHPAQHQLPQAQGLHRARGPALEQRDARPLQGQSKLLNLLSVGVVSILRRPTTIDKPPLPLSGFA
ncbi:hypothetical protein AVEN_42815-1 [Araneus ventricosus]|uniref:Uncharacterized protein n=1 Tax=Araneus ventricosus TaxID=182803 RepID=A0A4Y2AEQ0_ARAVE|nr:hypothetical protein AVEN_42815-1 [Araneus ventricosus]